MEKETCNAFAENLKKGKPQNISNEELLRMADDCKRFGFKIDFDKETKRQMFHENPNINPETRRKITIGGSVYESLVKKYGSPSDKDKFKINRDVKDMIHNTIKKVKSGNKTPVSSTRKIKNIQASNVVKKTSEKVLESSLNEDFEDLERPQEREFINIKSFKKLFGFTDKKKELPKEKEPLYETKTIKQICKEFENDPKIDPVSGKQITKTRRDYLLETCKPKTSNQASKQVSKQVSKKSSKKPQEKIIPSQPKISREKLLRDYMTSNRPLREEISNPMIINNTKGKYDRQGNKKPPRVCNAEM